MTALAWQIPLWVLGCIILVRLLVALFWLWRLQQERVKDLEGKLSHFIDEYAHALSLERIDHEETRQKNSAGEVIEFRQGVVLQLRNTIGKPLHYRVIKLAIDSAEGEDYQNRGSVVSSLSTTHFYSAKRPAPIESLDKHRQFEIDIEIEYGPPGKPLRLMHHSATLFIFPENQRDLLQSLRAKDLSQRNRVVRQNHS